MKYVSWFYFRNVILCSCLLITMICFVCSGCSDNKSKYEEGYIRYNNQWITREEYSQIKASEQVQQQNDMQGTSNSLTASEQNYLNNLIYQCSLLSNAFTEISVLFTNPQIGVEEWNINVAVQLSIIRVVYNDTLTISPPSSMVNIHSKYIQCLNHFKSATDLIAEGIDSLNPDLLNQATEEMLYGIQYLNETTLLLNNFNK